MQTLREASPCQKSGIISVFITNLGKYNEGELVGKWLGLPASKDDIHQDLIDIGIDNINYEEYFLTDYESPINGVTCYINEYSQLNEINELAIALDCLTEDELELYESAIELGDGISTLQDLISLTDKLDEYQRLTDVHNEYDLGYYWLEDSGCYDLSILGNLTSYIDYERFGRDIQLEQSGLFTTNGYIYRNE